MAQRHKATQRTVDHLRKQGVTVDKCERWMNVPGHPGGGVRKDLFGFVDLIAIRGGRIVAIQVSGITNIAAHRNKMDEIPAVVEWLNAGGLIEIWAWKKTLKGKAVRYESKVEAITLPS